MLADNYADLQDRVLSLIDELGDPDGLKRQKARHALIRIGWDAVPALIDVVSEKGDRQTRWEAIEVLAHIRDPKAAPVLIETLQDEDVGIRWAASNALIGLKRAAIKPLLIALTKHFDSVQFRQVARHILHVLKDEGRLLQKEMDVYEAFAGVEPVMEVPLAVKAALKDMDCTR